LNLKSLFVASLFVAGVTLASAGPALAGEITGNGKPTAIRDNAQSICSFSGYNDDPEIEPGRTVDHVQSWGQISQEDRQFLETIGLHPGDACNGHTGGGE